MLSKDVKQCTLLRKSRLLVKYGATESFPVNVEESTLSEVVVGIRQGQGARGKAKGQEAQRINDGELRGLECTGPQTARSTAHPAQSRRRYHCIQQPHTPRVHNGGQTQLGKIKRLKSVHL